MPKELVRALRERAGLSQEALANRLGLAGKAVVSGWETGRTSCEGPAAELLLHLFAGDTSRAFNQINANAESSWRRAGTWHDSWRQIAAVPEVSAAIEREVFAKLFPGAEIPSEQHSHGFPFVERGADPSVFGIGANGWSGAIPPERERAPHHAWQLDRASAFLYREAAWEEALDSPTCGHTHVGSLLALAGATAVFMRRLAATARLQPDARFALRLDLEGMQRRGIASGPLRAVEMPKMLSNEIHLFATIGVSIDEVVESPLMISYRLVKELLSSIRPDLATEEQLAQQLIIWLDADRRRDVRSLAYLDALLPG